MSARTLRTVTAPLMTAVVFALAFTVVIEPEARQRASEASTPAGQEPPAVPGGGGRGRGRGPTGPPPPARQGAPVDLTGNWVSIVTEDWQWRMRTPPKGDYASVPMTPQARQLADTWDPSKDGMPVVVMRASDVGRTGYETRDQLDKDTELKAQIEAIRLAVGPMMNLGDVKDQTVPKMILLAPPRESGVVSTRSFIPHRAHATIGVFAAVSVATACLLPDSPAHSLARIPDGTTKLMLVEHPTGASPVSLTTDVHDGKTVVTEAAIISTARALFEGRVLVP